MGENHEVKLQLRRRKKQAFDVVFAECRKNEQSNSLMTVTKESQGSR